MSGRPKDKKNNIYFRVVLKYCFSTRLENKTYIPQAIMHCFSVINKYRENNMYYLNGSTLLFNISKYQSDG